MVTGAGEYLASAVRLGYDCGIEENRTMRKIVLTIVALASVLATGAPAPAVAAPTGQGTLAAILALPDAVEPVQSGQYERQRRFRARQAARHIALPLPLTCHRSRECDR